MALPLLSMALLAGAAYKKHQTDERDLQRDEEDRAAVLEERAFRRGERDRATAERNRVADAYAPVTMQSVMTRPDTADDRDVGTPGTELTDTGVKRVGQQTFGPDQAAAAEAAVAAANTPEAQTARASQAMLSMGNVAGAQQLRTGAQQEKLGKLQLDKAQQDHLNALFDASLQPLASHDAIAQLVSGSNLGGALQLKAVPSADGKSVEYQMVGSDGTAKPTGYSFSNDARGLLEAKAAMSKLTPVTQKLEYLHKQDQLKRQAEKDAADGKHRDATLAETIRHNQQMEGVYRTQADAAVTRADNAGSKPTIERMDEPDKVTYQGIQKQRATIETRMGKIEDAILKAQADGMWDEASPNAVAMRSQMKTLQESLGALVIKETTLMRKYQGAPADPYGVRGPGAGGAAASPERQVPQATQQARDAEAGIQMVKSEFGGDVNRARAELAQMEAGIKAAPANEARTMLQAQAARLRAGIQAMSAQSPSAAPASVPTPAAAPARPMAGMADMIPGSGGVQAPPATAAAPAAPAAPAQVPFQQFLAQNITTPQGKSAILRRVRTELPALQQAILADAQVLQNPNVSPEVKATLNARIEANRAIAEMMQRFVDGNPGLVP